MLQKCPKCGYAHEPGGPQTRLACPACGLIFAKYLQAQQRNSPSGAIAEAAPDRPALLARLLYVPDRVESLGFYGRCAAYAFLLVWGWRLYAMDLGAADIMNSFMHLIVLPIHEAGHLLFIPFGHFMSVLGGSLLQVLLPLVLMASFVFGFGGSRRDNFAASVMLWWAAVSIIDLAPYIWDAFDPKLILLGGKTGAESDGHDWQNILGDLGMIRRAHLVAGIAHTLGLVLMLGANTWGAALLYLQFHRRDSSALEEDG
ncbi:MAG: hypothetical protein JJE42_01955 [Burkholderiales bacterium]|nr:hypothetical protein [Burkholderiales bacterium]